MRHINFDIFSNPSKFDLILLPCTCYQKKDGTVPVMKDSFLEKIVERCPSLTSQIGKGVEAYGNCPSILSHIPKTPKPTKFATFPFSPPALRAEDPDKYVYSRLKGDFKKFSLIPGWALMPRADMVEFSAIKLMEIIKYNKLDAVALPLEMFTFDAEDKQHADRILSIIERTVVESLFIVTQPHDQVQSNLVSSQVYFEEGE